MFVPAMDDACREMCAHVMMVMLVKHVLFQCVAFIIHLHQKYAPRTVNVSPRMNVSVIQTGMGHCANFTCVTTFRATQHFNAVGMENVSLSIIASAVMLGVVQIASIQYALAFLRIMRASAQVMENAQVWIIVNA